MAAEVDNDNDVAGVDGRDEHLLDIGEKLSPLIGPSMTQGASMQSWRKFSQEGEPAPAALQDFGDQPSAARRAAVAAGNVGLGPGLVDKDQAQTIKPPLIFFPLRSPSGDLKAIPRSLAYRLIFETDAFVLEEVPDRVAAHFDAARRELGQADPVMSDPAAPKAVSATNRAPQLAHRADCHPSAAPPDCRSHETVATTSRQAHLESGCDLSAALGRRNRRNHPLAKIKQIASGHRMPASVPASTSNQNEADLGFPNRFRPTHPAGMTQFSFIT